MHACTATPSLLYLDFVSHAQLDQLQQVLRARLPECFGLWAVALHLAHANRLQVPMGIAAEKVCCMGMVVEGLAIPHIGHVQERPNGWLCGLRFSQMEERGY